MQANETHQYKTKSEAKRAAIEAGLDVETLKIERANVGKGVMRWGWEPLDEFADDADAMVQAAEAEFGPVQFEDASVIEDDDYQSVDAILARNEARLAGQDIDDYQSAIDEIMAEPAPVTLHRVPVGVDSEIAHFHPLNCPVARLPVVPPYVAPSNVVEFPVVAKSSDEADSTEGLLVCDMESVDAFPTEGNTYLQLGPFLPFEGKNELLNLSKRMGIDGFLLDEQGRVVFRTERKAKGKANKAQGPRKIAMGAATDDEGKPVRPVINSVAHKSCEKLLDRIEECDGNADALRALVGTPGYKGGFTYGNIVVRYLMAWIEYADKHPVNDEVPGEEVFAEAAD